MMSAVLRNGKITEISIDVDPSQMAQRISAAEARQSERQPPLAVTEFLARITDGEYAAIIGAANAELGTGNAKLYRWIEILRATNQINVSGAEAQVAKAVLVASNLLTRERAELVFAPQG